MVAGAERRPLHPVHAHTLARRRRAGAGLALQSYVGAQIRVLLEAEGLSARPPTSDGLWQGFVLLPCRAALARGEVPDETTLRIFEVASEAITAIVAEFR